MCGVPAGARVRLPCRPPDNSHTQIGVRMDIRPPMLRLWLVAIRLGPAMVLVCAAVTYWSAERARIEPTTDDLSLSAERVAYAVDVYLARTINDLAMVTSLPALREEAARQSSRVRNADYEKQLNADWEKPDEDSGLERKVREILATEWSTYLHSIVRLDGMVIREVAIADR